VNEALRKRAESQIQITKKAAVIPTNIAGLRKAAFFR
jgi:hypothetical protein